MFYATMFMMALAVSAEAKSLDERTPHQLRQAVHAALKQSAPTARPNPEVVVLHLVALFDEVAMNQAMTAADQTRYQGLLKARLKSLVKQLKHDPPMATPAQVRLPPGKAGPHAGILAQQAGNQAAAGINNFNANPNAQQNRDVTSANADQLIDLIERTIAPTTWERAGGLGTIRYYRPLRVLVIRQTGDVHEQLGGLINGLNK